MLQCCYSAGMEEGDNIETSYSNEKIKEDAKKSIYYSVACSQQNYLTFILELRILLYILNYSFELMVTFLL